ncbi:hypothetical protein [Sorangium sp. So ce1024]|uniref:hypothetical protein n=1 Tax=Sorangium sp. So ce1024 TaxID=3133327 RepID=UPI003F08B208
MTKNELKHWEIWDGEVRLFDDGRVQYLDGDEWSDGWGPWVPPPPKDPDYAAYLEWDAAVTTLMARARKHSVEVLRPRRGGERANGAPAWHADVVFYHEGARVGTARWDGEGFVDCRSLCGAALYIVAEEGEDENEIYRVLAAHVRAHLARLAPGPAAGLALAL